MNAKKCDRCNSYYEIKPIYSCNVHYHISKHETKKITCFGVTVDEYEIKKDLDLCPKCMEELDEFLRGNDKALQSRGKE